jgi:hypothetical protein
VDVALRLVLAIGLLGTHTPICKIAVARSLGSTFTPAPLVPHIPTPVCKKSCCPDSSSPVKSDHRQPAKPDCPKKGDCPFCSAPPAVVSHSDHDVAANLGPTGHLIARSQTFADEVFHPRLDRPPRA